jgi:excisionase family DNA binding protein
MSKGKKLAAASEAAIVALLGEVLPGVTGDEIMAAVVERRRTMELPVAVAAVAPVEWLTTDEVAARLRVKPRTIRNFVKRGTLVPTRISHKCLRFSADQLISLGS